MMQATDIRQAAEQLRTTIRGDARNAFGALLQFAEAHAVSSRLKHEAILARLDQPNGDDPQQLEQLEQGLLDLVSRIETDHVEHWDAEAVAARHAALEETRVQWVERSRGVPPVCKAAGLGKRYARSDFYLRGVDLELRPGEITALVGQNANGKTTLLRIVAGELRHDEGTLEFPGLCGGRLNWSVIKSQVAYLPQDLPTWQGGLRDNLHYEAALHGILGADNEREVAYVVERFGLREHLSKRWSKLSGGTKLRFALARVLVSRPKLLVLDEPLANLDVLAQSRLLQDLIDLARSPRYPQAILMSSQHIHELEAVASSIIFLREGEVVFNGPIDAIGDARRYNTYELDISISLEELAALFSSLRCDPPYSNGVSYVLKTPLDVDAKAVLQKLQSADVDVTYFRDISHSAKRLFQ